MINEIKKKLVENSDKVEAWFEERWKGSTEPIYASVDIRNSHSKIAVVDTNAFPAGFNNLCPKYCRQLSVSFADYLSRHFPETRRVLIYPEGHTRNKYYMENVNRLEQALLKVGYEVRIGTIDPKLRTDKIALEAVEGEAILYRVARHGDMIEASGFAPDLVLSNNDFSTGVPEIFQGLTIPIVPLPAIGWHQRKKHIHFQILNRLIEDFSIAAGIDPWRISTHVSWCSEVDFKVESSKEKLAGHVDKLLAKIKNEYDKRGISEEPFVFIKHNAGTYGMAMMTARSGDEVRKAVRKTRVKMQTGKGKTTVSEVMVQEGIPTRDLMGNFPMEPVIYMVGEHPVGGFYRLHRQRTESESLNVRGMEFRKLCFHQVAQKHPASLDDRCEDAASLLQVYGALARLSVLALGMEMKELEKA